MVPKILPTLLVAATFIQQSIAEQQHKPTRTTVQVVPRAATTTATRCTPGTWSAKGSSPCTDCSAGSYSKESGVTSCIPARAGYYVPAAKATTETACKSATYASATGSSSCAACPAGYMCPSDALANPQACSPGRYSTGGLAACTYCSAGTFNSIQAATGCCPCAAGWYNDQPGNTNCQACSNQYPYSNPGTGSTSGCSAKPGSWQISKTCQQSSGGVCPTSNPFSTASAISRRRVAHAPLCRKTGQKACPVHGYNWRVNHHHHGATTSYECVNILSDLESCGGCVAYSLDGQRSPDGGRDCSAIPNIAEVRCQKGQCIIDACKPGFIQSADGEHCVPDL